MVERVHHITDLEELERVAIHGRSSLYPEKIKIMVGTATCGRAAGAGEVLDKVREFVETR